MPPCLSVAIGGTKDVGFRWQHHVVEALREHRCREESDRPERLRTGVGEVVSDRRREHKDAVGPDRVSAAVFHIQRARAGDDILRLLGGIGMPAQPCAGSIS